MLLLQNFTHRLRRTSPTDQVVDGEPKDVEKDTPQTTESREMAHNRFIPSRLSSSFKARGHGLKHTLFNGLSTSTHESHQSPTYRGLPIISGVLIPFSILLSIPGLTARWYIKTDENHVTLDTRPNPLLLDLGMGFSMACGVLANICLVVRFAERNVLWMTWLCIVFLTLHDIINICAVTIFGVQHRFNDGFTYGQSFWFTVCSTIASTATNITLAIDYSRTKDFVNCGSGLTHKQRSLVIIIIVLLSYLALGSLIQSFILHVSFIDALYFSLVSIETIGFGDLRPISAGTRIFSSFYIAGGMLNLALAVALLREVLLEGVAIGFQARVIAIRTRQRERRIRTRWRTAVKLRLRDNNVPMWVVDNSDENDDQDWHYHHKDYWWKWLNHGWNSLRKRLSCATADRHPRRRKHLNLEALSESQMEEAALEAGAPLADLLPPRLQSASLAAISDDLEGDDDEVPISDRGGVPLMQSMTMQDEASLEDTLAAEEKVAFFARLTVALLVFIVFWMAGSAIFMKTETWSFGTAAYFCFISFTTVGYGDFSPQTPAGRSIFVVWALLGVAAMTILISSTLVFF
ncbi:voltage-gated potassium channel [Phlegmacium glaucopus]|nr:voltage-gated potassium channel [Phlegmacium glaucopus]